jgi:hypothetical protein
MVLTSSTGPRWVGLIIMRRMLGIFCRCEPEPVMSEPAEWTHFDGKPLLHPLHHQDDRYLDCPPRTVVADWYLQNIRSGHWYECRRKILADAE